MRAAELISEIYDLGITLVVDHGNIRCRSSEPLSDGIRARLKAHKAEVIDLLNYQKRRHGKPRLFNDELRVRGLLPPGVMLDTLLELNAPDDVIERHIHPIGTPFSWARWENIRRNRKPN